MSTRLAAYAVCADDGRVLLVRCAEPNGEHTWSLPGGGVEHGEDPFDAVVREVAEETGYDAVAESLLGVGSRVIPAAERWVPGQEPHQNVGVFYRVRITGASRGRSRTGRRASRCGHRSRTSSASGAPPWWTSASPWCGPHRRPATSIPSPSAAWSSTEPVGSRRHRSSCLRTLPLGLRGRAGRNSTWRGSL
ncbi:NUDIX domain-containing protein [Saccharopolyspora sp. NFXS83]|uniref:NUDIX hydrolase n=1 Tax=Saccharopolyspora sp. NFXS83 TaxID=2993560 RepID=UPI00224B493A|nr:NUDIX domain-containing protein [Saccharopolyspora sp. NFXS83]MCX2730437.1 NUDIX domain-containing protein [Saccharopolyspora sp. NFXS83]